MSPAAERLLNLASSYRGLSAKLTTTVGFMDASGRVSSSGQLNLVDISSGNHIAVVNYSGAPHRVVRLRGKLLASFGVDAVEAESIVSP